MLSLKFNLLGFHQNHEIFVVIASVGRRQPTRYRYRELDEKLEILQFLETFFNILTLLSFYVVNIEANAELKVCMCEFKI